MKCNREELLSAFKAVEAGLASKEILSQSTSLKCSEGTVFTYNDRVAISHPLPEGWEWEGAIHASEAIRLLTKMAGDAIDVDENEGTLLITDGKTRAEFKTDSELSEYHKKIGVPEKWVKLPDDFWKAVRFASFCASRSLQRPILTYVHVKGDQVEATDNNRLLVQKIKGKVPEMLIPSSVVGDLCGHACTEAGVTQGWLHYRNEEGAVFSCRTLIISGEETFPNVSKALAVEGVTVVFPKDLRAGVSKCRDVFDAKEVLPSVMIEAKKGKLQISAKGPHATVKERYAVTFKDELSFRIHPDMLDDALKASASCIVGERRLRLDGGKEGWVHVVSLIRAIEQAPAAPAEEAGE